MKNKEHFVQIIIVHLLFSWKWNFFQKLQKYFFSFLFIFTSTFLRQQSFKDTCIIINKPVKSDDPTTSYNFESPIYQA